MTEREAKLIYDLLQKYAGHIFIDPTEEEQEAIVALVGEGNIYTGDES